MAEFVDFLNTTRVGDFLKPKDMIIVESSSTLDQLLNTFYQFSIFSAPVVDQQKVVGVVDMLDVVNFIIEFSGLKIQSNLSLLETNPQKFTSILGTGGNLFSESTVSTILNNRQNKLFVVRNVDPCIKLISIYNDIITKVFILDELNEIINLASQTDVLAIVAQNVHLLGDRCKFTVESSGICTSFKKSFTSETRVINILKEFLDNNMIAAPIIDPKTSKLVANFSITNIKSLKKDNFDELMLPVLDYLRFQSIKEKKRNLSCLKENSFYPLTCYANDTLEYAIFKLVATKVHRLWVIDQNGQPNYMIGIDSILKNIALPAMEVEKK